MINYHQVLAIYLLAIPDKGEPIQKAYNNDVFGQSSSRKLLIDLYKLKNIYCYELSGALSLQFPVGCCISINLKRKNAAVEAF